MVLCMCLIGFGFSSCDEDDLVELLPDFDINLSESEEIPVSINQTDGAWVEFSETKTISIKNKDTEDYLNKIKSVKLTKLSYRIINFKGDASGEVEAAFSADNGVALNNAFVVNTAFQNGIVYEVEEIAELNRIGNALKSGNAVMVKYSGKALCNDGAMDFDVEVTYEAKVTVNP